MSERLIAYSYFGGKNVHLDWLLPQLPKCRHFVDVFGGSGSVVLNRDPSPLDTFNDLNGHIVNFFRQMRDHGDELVHLLSMTPHSREEFLRAQDVIIHGRGLEDVSPLERARLFFIHIMQGFGSITKNTGWCFALKKTRRGQSLATSKWWGGVERLPLIIDRLRRIQIENRNALEIIPAYDSIDTLFYVDPPYPFDSRTGGEGYRYELTNREHHALAAVLNKCKGLVALSSYRCQIYDELFSEWRRYDSPLLTASSTNNSSAGDRKERRESLWCNYSPLDSEGNAERINVEREETSRPSIRGSLRSRMPRREGGV